MRCSRSHSCSGRCEGFSLIELMIAMVIGLFVIGAVSAVFISARQSARYQEALSRLQQNGRTALDLMEFAIRNAGYKGCGSEESSIANVVNGGAWWGDLSVPLIGYDGGFPSQITDVANPVAGTDAVVAIGVDSTSEINITNHNPPSAQFNTGVHSLQRGNILLVTDCKHAALFQMTGPSTANPDNLVHNTGAAVAPGNCTKYLGQSCGSPAKVYAYDGGASIMRLYARSFYIAPSGTGNGSSLWSIMLQGDGSTQPSELVEGIEDLQLEYGIDVDADLSVDDYVTADEVVDWEQVTAVRIHVLAVSAADGLTTDEQTYWHHGESVEANDRRLRRSFSSVVAIRNRNP